MRVLVVLFVFFGCAKAKPEPKALPDLMSQRTDYVTRLLTTHLDHGQVVTIDQSGAEQGQGDAQVFNGAARYALTCDEGDPVDQEELVMLAKEGGAIVRFEPLPQSYVDGKNQASMDTGVGFDLEAAVSVARCNQRARWHDAWQQHMAYLAAHGQQLYDGTGAFTPPGFDLPAALIAHELGLGGVPPDGQLQTLETEAVAWATADVAAKAACYRLNLIEMTFTAVELFGVHPGQTTLDALCELTKGIGMPVWDHRCGRTPLSTWMQQDWTPGSWQYRHQRCGSWEAPDGDGMNQPYVDWLYAWQRQYGEGI